MDWGPYRNQPEAKSCVSAFSDEVFKRHLGVIWSSDDDAMWLRPPIYDSDGFGLTLLARYDGVTTPATPAQPSVIDQIDRFLGGALTQIGNNAVAREKANLAVAQTIDGFIYDNAIKPINDVISRYEYVKDGITVVLDVAGVIAGGAAAVALATVGGGLVVTVGLALGVIAGVASLGLLVEDGRHLWFSLRGDEAGKLGLEAASDFRWIEAVGPLLAMPDLLLSGRAALREATVLAAKADRAAQLSTAAAARSQQLTREARELVADSDQSAPILREAARLASKRAADYKRMVLKSKEYNQKLLMAREAVTAYGGTLWGGALYAYDPPALAREAYRNIVPAGGLPPAPAPWMPPPMPAAPGLQSAPPGPASLQRLTDANSRVSLSPSDNPWGLLEPREGGRCSSIPTSGLQLTTIVASRPTAGKR